MSTYKYDYLIVGSGLFGAVYAYMAKQKGKKCLVIDRRSHTGGNIYCENVNGINVHKYGAHIFHTNDKGIWDFVNQFVEFNRYTNSPIANFKGELFNLPFNMNTFYQLWKVKTPEEARAKIAEQVKELGLSEPQNLEEQALSMVGGDIYQKLIKGYTEKQWGRAATDLPSFIIKRLPLRFTYDNNYFNDKYQGIPIGGYNKLTEGLLEGIEVKTACDFFEDRAYWSSLAEMTVYTGKIDEFYDYRFGELNYRSLDFEHAILEIENYQGNAVVNYTEREVPYTRIIEHKHFEFGTQPTTVITKEYPSEYALGKEPYYPINDEGNTELFRKYSALAVKEEKVIFGGRLAEYRYYDMHQVIGSALKSARETIV
ncbi:UDP-galactopyranose mutase [Chitinophaga parva]|uniref:UDP-galactopyranose mutase n=1 Tax=Chitinophaga parva TaxID=2169414 RepID=A0A2T7BKC5_9BACT|nr:UDP-galactopyranose mutase [Chitinophaga parva]PUZ28125.1 UDP-galactopyranose mutase [Chitinophaga parva]